MIAEKIATLEMKELSERQRADLAIMRQRQAQARARSWICSSIIGLDTRQYRMNQ